MRASIAFAIAGALGLIAIAGWLLGRWPAAEAPAEGPARNDLAAEPPVASRREAPRPIPSPARAASAAEARPPPPRGGPVRIEPAAELATVNGVAVHAERLIAGGTAPLSRERYALLLERAIDDELVFQAAEAKGIRLADGERARLETLREAAMARERAALAGRPLGVAGTVEERAELEVRDAEARLLMNRLLEADGAPPAHVTPAQVEAYYREHRAELDELYPPGADPAAARQAIDIEVRSRLSQPTQAEHLRRWNEYVEGLRARARIDRHPR